MSATSREIATNHLLRTELAARRLPSTGRLPFTSWPEFHSLGYDVWNGMTLCSSCANYADQQGDLWDPQNDYYLQGVRSVTVRFNCGNCGNPIRPPLEEGPACCWCDDPSEGLVDPDSPACGEHLRQYGGESQ